MHLIKLEIHREKYLFDCLLSDYFYRPSLNKWHHVNDKNLKQARHERVLFALYFLLLSLLSGCLRFRRNAKPVSLQTQDLTKSHTFSHCLGFFFVQKLKSTQFFPLRRTHTRSSLSLSLFVVYFSHTTTTFSLRENIARSLTIRLRELRVSRSKRYEVVTVTREPSLKRPIAFLSEI